ncbi:MAG: polysaccharide deacetylase family protein [Betaproteobacteria bacterium]
MNAQGGTVPVLTFHSISSEPGPTSIAPETFRMQMDVLAECGFGAMTCQEFIDWHQGRASVAGDRVLITFDDGFADFATAAFPILRERGLASIVFVPTGKLGDREGWRGANAARRALMDWSTVRELAEQGVEFGGHGINHADLTRLDNAQRRREIEGCATELAEKLGRRTRSFAAPYGHVNRDVLADLARTYDVAFGTQLERAQALGDRFDVPRIEMHYFRNPRRWRNFVRGGTAYFALRRALRAGRIAGTRLFNLGGTFD